MTIPEHATAALVFSDGSVFFGQGIGQQGITVGEICFNTGLTGYQEILTDPSYCGQIVTFTFPHIGNVGANPEDYESKMPVSKGLIVREPITSPSNFRHKYHLQAWLEKYEITGICGVDTRAITRKVRKEGAQNVAIQYFVKPSELQIDKLQNLAKQAPLMKGLELAKTVTCSRTYEWSQTLWTLDEGHGKQQKPLYHVVAIDYGAKHNILRCLASVGCKVTVVPATTTAEKILSLNPDGVFLSNGPGDPSATGEYAIPIIQELIENALPIFGICLGHQLLALALGCQTLKMHQGHRGNNQPVMGKRSGKVEITSQNHGFVVAREEKPEVVEVTHDSLFDGTIEGIGAHDGRVFSVQHHPEASPGPHDSFYLFEQFVDVMKQHKKKK
jgi:carbamoyl-phosphate synthase small subunit